MQAGYLWNQYLDLCTCEEELDLVQANRIPNPVAVGAVGGSGSRLVRNILLSLGVEMMNGISEAGDAHAWPPMDRILSSSGARHSSRAAMCSHTFAVLESFLQELADRPESRARVGWKNPNTFLWLPELAQYFPQFRYVHVIRHGLDMAYSRNIRQFRMSHWYFGIQTHEMGQNPNEPIGRDRVLDYWIESNRYALKQFKLLPERHFLLVYDDLCENPQEEIERLAQFLDLSDTKNIVDATAQVTPNPSIGRYKDNNWRADFRPDQIEAVRELGFSV